MIWLTGEEEVEMERLGGEENGQVILLIRARCLWVMAVEVCLGVWRW